MFTLARPGYLPVAEVEYSFDSDIPGDSHVAISPPAIPMPSDHPDAAVVEIRIYATTDQGELVFTGYPNARGYLGRLVTELQAADFKDAEHRAYRALAPTLSNWSVHLDVPLHVWRIHVTALETGSVQISAVNPFDEMPINLAQGGTMSAEFRGLASLYREALESNSSVYQFLCLFKIAEGIRFLRKRIADQALTRGKTPPTRPIERVPKDPTEFVPWLKAIYAMHRPWDEMALDSTFVADARGRKFNDVLDKELTDLRVDVAHALSDETGNISLIADEALHLARVNKWLPLLKCMVRRMLKNDFPAEFLPYLREDGTIIGSQDEEKAADALDVLETMEAMNGSAE